MGCERRRVLIVTPDPPLPTWGFGTRVHQLARYLSAMHHVTLLTSATETQAEDVRLLLDQFEDLRVVPSTGSRSRSTRRTRQAISLFSRRPFYASELHCGSMREALADCIAELKPDVVQVESSRLFGFRFPVNAPVVLDEHNIESELLERMYRGEHSVLRRLYNALEFHKYRRVEQEAWGRAAAVVVTSNRESAVVAARLPKTRVNVVPNGVDPDYFAPSRTAGDPATLVFTGLLSYRPNLEGVRWFLDHVLPRIHQVRPEVTVLVVGGSNQPESLEVLTRPHVTFTGWVPDVRPFLAGATAVIVPIRVGGGTRLKLVEALSMAKPTVTTSVGCEGIDVADQRHVLIADDPAEFAGTVLRLLGDPDLRCRLGQAGRDLVLERYSWQRSASLLNAVHDELLESQKAAV